MAAVQYLRESPAHRAYTIGTHSYGVDGSPHIFTWAETATLTIGAFCSFAPGCKILLDAEHRPDWITTYPIPLLMPGLPNSHECVGTKGDVVIGNDVWVGMDAVILSGVTIGDGAVVGAGAMVTKNVEPYAIVAGNPARFIRYRFAPDVCAALQETAWWNWPIEKIKALQPLLFSSDVHSFLQQSKENVVFA
jgi:acetyltransferase-like isoleucine patch superfamily enzyme